MIFSRNARQVYNCEIKYEVQLALWNLIFSYSYGNRAIKMNLNVYMNTFKFDQTHFRVCIRLYKHRTSIFYFFYKIRLGNTLWRHNRVCIAWHKHSDWPYLVLTLYNILMCVILILCSFILFYFVFQGNILECDEQLAHLHGFCSSDCLVNMNVKELIPSLILPTPGEPISKVPELLITREYQIYKSR